MVARDKTIVLVFNRWNMRVEICPHNVKHVCNSFSRNQYKCGAFMINLAGQNESLRWVSALPDMLQKPNVKASANMRNLLGNVHKKTFSLQPGFCNEIYANTRCLALVS